MGVLMAECRSTEERFFEKFEKVPSGCWEWQGYFNQSGSKGRMMKGAKATERSLRFSPKGSRHGNAKLQERDVIEIKELRSKGLFYHQIAEKFGVHKMVICGICLGKAWRHVNG